jgi:hypothetical protein
VGAEVGVAVGSEVGAAVGPCRDHTASCEFYKVREARRDAEVTYGRGRRGGRGRGLGGRRRRGRLPTNHATILRPGSP